MSLPHKSVDRILAHKAFESTLSAWSPVPINAQFCIKARFRMRLIKLLSSSSRLALVSFSRSLLSLLSRMVTNRRRRVSESEAQRDEGLRFDCHVDPGSESSFSP